MTALIKVTLNPGLWGETTAKHSAEFIREKTRLSPCNTTLIFFGQYPHQHSG